MASILSAYDFLAPSRIVFGWGRRTEVGELARPLGRRAFLVSGSRTLEATGTLDAIAAILKESGVDCTRLVSISHEPEVADVDSAVAALRDHHLDEQNDFVVAVGGGSAIDLAKAVAALATNRHGETVADFLEGVGRGLKIENPPLPMLAMPTTAGTGSEATKNAVISSYAPPFKKSLRSDRMVPDAVLVDPELSVSVPATVTAHTGMDAITQLIESYISRRAKPLPRALCLEGLAAAIPAIVEAVENPTSRPAREAMAHAAMLSGMALANSGLGMAHGVAAALGVHCRVPHGLACAVMLPVAMRSNRNVAEEDLAEIGRLIAGDPSLPAGAAADAVVERIQTISNRIGVPRTLKEIGVERALVPALVQSSRGNSMNGNPRELSDEELTRILEELT